MAEALLLKPEEAFEVIRVRRAKGFKMLKSGEIPSIKIGSLRRIPDESLQKWITELAQEAEAASRTQ